MGIFLAQGMQFLYLILSSVGKQMFLHGLPSLSFFFFVRAMYLNFFNFLSFIKI